MKVLITTLSLCLTLSAVSWAETSTPQQAAQQIQRLTPSDQQVRDVFGLVLGELPRLLDESAQPEDLARELAPKMMQMLNPEQRDALRELDLEQNMTNLGSMSRQERKAAVFGALRLLTHPSKQEWLERVEDLSN